MGIIFLIPLGTAIWVWIDASKLGFRRGRLGGGPLDMGVASYVLATLLIWIIGFPCYLVARGKYVEMKNGRAYVGAPYGAGPTYGVAPPPTADPNNPYSTPSYAAQTVAPQYSPDGQWWWNGQAWTPVTPTPAATPFYGGDTVLPS